MDFPRMSARRWFWTLLVAASLWCWLGARTEGAEAPANVSLIKHAENMVRAPLGILLTPGRYLPFRVQQFISWTFVRASQVRTPGESVEDMRDRNRTLENENTYLSGQLQQLQDKIDTLTRIKETTGISARDIVSANITGYQSGMATNLISLDKGTSDGVQRGMVVLSKLSPLGRVQLSGLKTCEVQLVTDPRVKVQASIIRRTREGSTMVLVPNCLVSGMGEGQLACDTVKVNDVALAPEKGDLVLLMDRAWPSRVHSTVLGEVTEVGRRESQRGRFDIHIIPRVNINSITAVMILTNP